MKLLLSLPPNSKDCFHDISHVQASDVYVDSDPEERRVGSGGGTVHLLYQSYLADKSALSFEQYLETHTRCVIHGGGQSRRLPAYASCSKLLTPIPVHRWSRGQKLNQTLLDLQLPLFKDLLEKSAPSLNCLIASGDVLVKFDGDLGSVPEADVVCLGLWAKAEQAQNHGVFFSDRKSPESLDFMLQKPNIEQINDLSKDKLFLIDVGVWLLSARAQQILAKKSAPNGDYGDIQFYDLYSAFGPALGKSPSIVDEDINSLTCAVKILDDASFLHFGTSAELIESSQALQNETLNQKRLFNSHGQEHRDVFQQNAAVELTFTVANHKIWIENSYLPKTWVLSSAHVITGVPQNEWNLKLPPNICLDFIPLKNGKICLRPYGIYDKFNEPYAQAIWMGAPLGEFFAARKIEAPEDILHGEDLQEARLFPVFVKEDLTSDFIQWMIGDANASQPDLMKVWIDTTRLSAAQIQTEADLVALESQRRDLRQMALPKMAENWQKSVFYQLDLKQVAAEYPVTKLAKNLGGNESLSTKINDYMFRSQALFDVDVEKSRAWEEKAFGALREELIKTKDDFSRPHYDILADQIIWGRSPARVDLAGGWSDTPPYCQFFGGNVLNVAVNLNGQPPIQVFVKKNNEAKIEIRSIDLGLSETIYEYADLDSYDQVGSGFVIPKAALVLCGFSADEKFGHGYDSLEQQLKAMGGGFEITMLVAIPKGSGLGTSSILASTVLGVFNKLFSLAWDDMTICQNTLILEQMLTAGGGWQDQFGGVYRGVKLFSTQEGLVQTPRCQWYSARVFDENKDKILLYYTGITRVAKNILSEIVRGMFLNSHEHLETVHAISKHGAASADSLLSADYEKLAASIERSWELNKQLDLGTSTAQIEAILERIKPYTLGKKLLGAGGGGYLLIFAKDRESAKLLKQDLESKFVAPGARFVDMSVSQTGLEVTES